MATVKTNDMRTHCSAYVSKVRVDQSGRNELTDAVNLIEIRARWKRYRRKGKGNSETPPASYYQVGAPGLGHLATYRGTSFFLSGNITLSSTKGQAKSKITQNQQAETKNGDRSPTVTRGELTTY